MLAMNERLDELQRQLDHKTSEIESVVAADRGMGSISDMNPSEYKRLQQDVEELLERWEEEAQEGSGDVEDTPLNRLIAERFEIEQEILAARGEDEGTEVVGARTLKTRQLLRRIDD
jgi:hypothetical protein